MINRTFQLVICSAIALTIIIPGHITFAATAVKTTTSVKTTPGTNTTAQSLEAQAKDYQAAPATAQANAEVQQTKSFFAKTWDSIVNFAIGIYNQVDAWRVHQLGIWQAIKAEKEQQIADRNQQMDQKIQSSTDQVLNGDKTTMYQGSFQTFDGNILLLKIYSFALLIFVLIFSTPAFFYAIIAIIVYMILNSIINRIRGPRGL